MEQAIKAVGDWLTVSSAGPIPAPGKTAIARRYRRFLAELAAVCAAADQEMEELTFTQYADIASTWLQRELS